MTAIPRPNSFLPLRKPQTCFTSAFLPAVFLLFVSNSVVLVGFPPFTLPQVRLEEKPRQSRSLPSQFQCALPSTQLLLNSPEQGTPLSILSYIKWHRETRACFVTSSCAKPPKVLIWRCHPDREGCGGAGDRIRGILFTFLLAVSSNRLFFIDWSEGGHSLFDIRASLLPASLDWSIPRGAAIPPSHPHFDWALRKDWTRLPLGMRKDNKRRKFLVFSDSFAAVSEPFPVIAVQTNYPYSKTHLVRSLSPVMDSVPDLNRRNMTDVQFCRVMSHTLFRPSPALELRVREMGLPRDTPYTAVHVRTGEDVSENDRGRFEKLSRNRESIVSTLLQYVALRNHTFLFVASDDVEFKFKIVSSAHSRGIIVRSNERPALHVGKVAGSSDSVANCDGFMDVFVDMIVLSRAETLITTGSGFATAAFHMGRGKRMKELQGNHASLAEKVA